MKTNVPETGTFRDHRFFLALLLVNVVLARIAMRLYGEHFVLLHDAISDLGATVTRGGMANRRSPWVFVIQMLVSSVMCLRYARLLARRSGREKDNRVWLIRMCATGFVLMPAPHNLPVTHYVHMFGAGFIFFSLWMLTMMYLSEGKRRGFKFAFWIGMITLQATVLTYAFLFAIDAEVKQIAQGFALLGMLGVLISSTQLLARAEAAHQSEEVPSDATASTRG